MNLLSWIYAALFSAALLWCLLGSLWRLMGYWRTPQPLPIPLTPAPRTRAGVVGRLLLELLLFRSLYRAGRAGWLASIAFHYGLLGVLIIHLRFVFTALPGWLLPLILMGGYITTLMVAGLLALGWRRFGIDRLRYLSAPSDHLYLLLLLSIAASGVALKRIWPTELAAVNGFLRGVLTVQWQPLPDHPVLLLHLTLVLLLLLVFPLGKLLHGPAMLFSPTFNQRDRARRRTPVGHE